MLQGEHSAILLTFIKLLVVIKISVLSIFEWPFYTGFTVYFFQYYINPELAGHKVIDVFNNYFSQFYNHQYLQVFPMIQPLVSAADHILVVFQDYIGSINIAITVQ